MRRRLTVAFALALLHGALPADAHVLNPPATRVTGMAATLAGGGFVEVAGLATFGGQRLTEVATDPTGDGATPFTDLVQARLAQLDISTGDLNFVLKLSLLPPVTGGIPEVPRYAWDFGIDMGGESPVRFQVDGRMTDVVGRGVTRTPAFYLRTCGGQPVACQDAGTLVSELVGADSEVFVDVPLAMLEAHAGGPVAGRRIVPAPVARGIAAVPSVGAVEGPSDVMPWSAETGSFPIGVKEVHVGIVPAGAPMSATEPATLDGSSFSDQIDVSGLAPGAYDVWAKACYGTNCGTRSARVTIP